MRPALMEFPRQMLRSSRFMITILGLVLVLRIILAGLFPLTGDEGYYWLWSRHLAISYVDHPPMIALIDGALVWIFRDPLLALRAGAVIFTLLVLWVLYTISREVAPAGAASDLHWRNLVIFALVPNTVVIWMALTGELPFVLCYLWALLAVIRFLRSGSHRYLYLAGFVTGLGLLTKYTMVLVFPVILLFVVVDPGYRHLMRRPAFWLSGMMALAMFAPVAAAEAQRGGESFLFHAQRIGAVPWFTWTLAFVGDQILYLSPFLAYVLVRYYWVGRKDMQVDPAIRLLSMAGALPFLFFLALSVKTQIWPHWLALTYGPFAVLAGTWLSSERHRRGLATLMTGMAGLVTVLLLVLALWTPGVLRQQAAYRANYTLAAKAKALLRDHPRTIFASDSHSTAAQLTYYARVETVMPTRLLAVEPWTFGRGQFDRWNTRELRRGDTLVFFASPESRLYRAAKEHFQSVELLPGWRLTVLETYTREKRFYLARGFKPESARL